ncbi:MAG: hypothetical protein F6K40_36490 [Okeania sp. SIO3I5]|uniref:hypothetical protein n=1 Tax=Okeania sp. SIO3I5 TaxID=2607805 RepID=UPI0013BBE9B0|nr:hypothetical protein [Okeania sp. SIO3I5]NEQ41400.1 hypothetical protein [Okeania sp. SIO3I5]
MSQQITTKEDLISQIKAAEYLNPKALVSFGITNEKAAKMVGISLRQFYRYEHTQPPKAIRKFGATLARQLISEGKEPQPDLVYIIVRHLESE